ASSTASASATRRSSRPTPRSCPAPRWASTSRCSAAGGKRSERGRRVSLLALALVFLIGALIGAVGVGGFLLVPVLVFLDGRPVRDAVVLATVSFVGAGAAAFYMEARHRGWSGAAGRLFVVAS